MARVRLIQESGCVPSDNTIEETHFPQVPRVAPRSPFHLAEEGLGHHLLHPVQVGVIAGEGEIAPVDDAPE
eukprot:15476770-Alexandrium_andersonii.AAC.1